MSVLARWPRQNASPDDPAPGLELLAAPPAAITEQLKALSRGDPRASEHLLPLIYRELQRQAARFLRRERPDHTLEPSALVHEAYLRLVGQDAAYQNRCQFFALAARMMRRVLVDHARARGAAKRPCADLRVTLDGEPSPPVEPREVDLLGLDAALTMLASLDPRQVRVVELRYFAGLTATETALALGVSVATVKREWSLARAWLFSYLTRSDR
jgi:RNA polymerase sigma-70 factor, ECF subfamily